MVHIDLPSDDEVDQAAGDDPPPSLHWVARVGLPVVLAIAGVVLLITGPFGVGIVLLLAAAIAAVADRIIRLAIVSQGDRDREERRRGRMRRSGRWS